MEMLEKPQTGEPKSQGLEKSSADETQQHLDWVLGPEINGAMKPTTALNGRLMQEKDKIRDHNSTSRRWKFNIHPSEF